MHFQNPKDSQTSREGFSVSQPYPARRHKLGCFCLSALISSRASAPRLADFDPRPTGGRAGGRAPAAPDGRAGACGARSTERLRRSLTARLRRDGLIPKTKTYLWPCFTLPLHLPSAYEASSARHGCASLIGARGFILSRTDHPLESGGCHWGILHAARRPADPVKSCPCFILRRLLPRASDFEISFCAPFGALRLAARLIGGGWFYSESMILSRIDYLIPHYISEPRGEGRKTGSDTPTEGRRIRDSEIESRGQRRGS